MTDPGEVDAALREQAARTTSRRELQARHDRLDEVSPDVGQLDDDALAAAIEDDTDSAVELLVDLARATDRDLRARARAVAARILVPAARRGDASRSGAVRLATSERQGPDLDLDTTVERVAARGGDPLAVDLRWRRWQRPGRAYVLVVDASGSVTGRPLATAVATAAALAARVGPDDELAVVAFWSKALVLRPIDSAARPDAVLDALFDLRGGDTTDVAGGLRAALAQATRARASRREVIVLTDGLATAGADPTGIAAAAAAAGTAIHVLGLSDATEADDACRTLAAAGGGRHAPLLRTRDAPGALAEVLAGT